MTVTGGSALSKDEIDRMIKEAESHADEDKKRREGVEARNEAEQLVFRTEKLLDENDENLEDDIKQPVKDAVAELKTALEGEDIDEIKNKMENLNGRAAEMGQAVYAKAQADAANQPGTEAEAGSDDAASADDDVVDAEIVDEDDDKSDK